MQDLKRRRFDRWKRNESIKLVQDYITCVDELTLIVDLYVKKLDFLSRLRKDCELFEFQDNHAPNNARGKPATVRIDWAIGVVEEAYVYLDSMLKDLKSSMGAVGLPRTRPLGALFKKADLQKAFPIAINRAKRTGYCS